MAAQVDNMTMTYAFSSVYYLRTNIGLFTRFGGRKKILWGWDSLN
ncbi:predicted protein [Sclerotinia sclerotiorum 1980 UF-70]|uniref:Uncharacterized protein n=1 Tax=Sclerotinia sclerotiorum (strain ATCC 18683 / 1980 / Ss-1) TaxID=665079 RepID=A7F732_SCLS1|nr:predicted protein [Sclerotinia sclerotiorum 1980 UF-70]EDN98553.1 predicted protein [Sclerotinia sclerotiorum 1980 UF-70]